RRLEALQLALRTREGVPVAALDLDDPSLEGLVVVDGDRAVLTPEGRLLANEVAVRLRTDVAVGVGRRAQAGDDGTGGTSKT
ncbi:MAG TPA: hypothetical protein DCS55_07430, partial [Acidimicrobiaceae bacterium]|nr:hypothetical protein [Acidimicrobiaceae bacterium]